MDGGLLRLALRRIEVVWTFATTTPRQDTGARRKWARREIGGRLQPAKNATSEEIAGAVPCPPTDSKLRRRLNHQGGLGYDQSLIKGLDRKFGEIASSHHRNPKRKRGFEAGISAVLAHASGFDQGLIKQGVAGEFDCITHC